MLKLNSVWCEDLYDFFFSVSPLAWLVERWEMSYLCDSITKGEIQTDYKLPSTFHK